MYLRLSSFADNTTVVLKPQIEAAFQFVDSLNASHKVLLHCAAGVSRSGAVMTALVARRLGCASIQQALEVVQAVRPIVAPNPGFIEQLEQWLHEQQDS